MGEEFIISLSIIFLVLAVMVGLRSIRALVALRREGREVKEFYEHELARQIREAIVDEIDKNKMAAEGARAEAKIKENPLTVLLKDIYDDLYARILEEEENRKKSLEELRAEIEKLRGERRG